MKKTKKILMLTFIFICILFTNNYVDADCLYKTTTSYQEDIRIRVYYEDGKLLNECTAKSVILEYEYSVQKSPSKCGMETTNMSSLFVIEDGTLYCPTKIYLNYENEKGLSARTYYSFATTPRTDEYSYRGNLIENSSPANGTGYASYTPTFTQATAADGTKYDKLSACTTGGASYLNNLSNKVDELEKKAKSIKDMTSSDMSKLYDSMNSISISNLEKYCDKSGAKTIADKYNKVVSDITSKVNSSSTLSKEQKQTISQELEKNYKFVGVDKIAFDDSTGNYTCEGLLDQDLIDIFKFLLTVVRIAAPIILIILISLDLGGAVISQDQDAIKKAVSKSIKRAIAGVALFFVPYIVGVILSMPGISEYTSGDPNCGL